MLSKLLNIGNTKSLDFENEIKVRLLNAFSFVFSIILGFYVLYNFFYVKRYSLALIEFAILLIVPLIILLQHKRKYDFARVVFFMLLHLVIFVTSVFLSPGKRIEYFYLVIVMLLMVLARKITWTYVIIFLDIILFFVPQIVFNVYPEKGFPYTNSVILVISTVWALRFFILIQNQYSNKLNVQKKRLESLNREKNDLMSIVAHDLKSPLAQIKGLVSILELEGGQLNKEQIELIDKIKGVTDNQNKQISQFLDANALEEKVEQITLQNFDAVATIIKVIAEMSTLASSKNIRIIQGFETKLILINGSEEGWCKIISNLYSNAIKYSQPQTTITLNIKLMENKVLFSIKDEGPGFKKEELDKVFSKNKVLSAQPTSNETASGIGLYIAKKYVDLMDGEIWLESTEGKGSTFFVKLPRGV